MRPGRRPPTKPRTRLPGALLLSVAAGGPVVAQPAGPAPSSRLVPLFSAEGGYIETRDTGTGDDGREVVLRLSPGFSYASRSGRLQGNFDYVANLFERRGRESTAGGEIRNALNAALTAELVPGWGFLDMNGSLTQQATSPFGQQTAEGSLQRNDSQVPVATASIRPHVQGRLGSFAQYQLATGVGQTRSKAIPGVDSRNRTTTASLESPTSSSVLGWNVRVTDDRTQYAGSEPVDTTQAIAGITYRPEPELQLALRGGRDNAGQGAAADSRATTTYGAGIVWAPSPRTNLSLDADRRYFGHSGRISLSHRMPRSTISYTLLRDVTRSSDTLAFTPPVTRLQLTEDMLASQEPNPDARRQLAIDMIDASGLDAAEPITFGYLTSSLSVRQVQTLAFSWFGARLSLTAQLFSDTSSQLFFSSIADPTTGPPVRQHGYAASTSYRLTPITSLTLGGERRMTFASGGQPGTDLKSATAGLSTQLGPRVSASLTGRYAVFNSSTTPYHETQLSGSLNLRF